MTRDQAQNLLNLAVHLARMRPGLPAHQIAADVREFSRLAGICRRVAVARCNGEGDESAHRKTMQRVGFALGGNEGVLGRYPGMVAQTEGDPRGYVFHLRMDPKRSGYTLPGNTLGGIEQGYGVE